MNESRSRLTRLVDNVLFEITRDADASKHEAGQIMKVIWPEIKKMLKERKK